MKLKIIKISAVLIAISLLFGGCMSESLAFDVSRIVLEENLDFTYRELHLANQASASYYKDTDDSFVVLTEEYRNRSLAEDDPHYDHIRSLSLMRIFPGQNKKSETVKIHEYVSQDNDTRIFEFLSPSSMWQNERGNTVVHYTRRYSNPAVPSERGNSDYDYIFEEYDKDFKLIKKAVHSVYDMPGSYAGNTMDFSAKDDNDNYYIATGGRIIILNADFEMLGAVEGFPDNPSVSIKGREKEYAYLMPSKGGDGAVYAYYFDKKTREIFKINPETLNFEYMFDIDFMKSATLYPGEGDALFYGVGEYLYSIDEKGKTKRVFKWGTNGIAPFFEDNKFITDDYENNEATALCLYQKDGNYYNILIEDKDGDEKTVNDKELVLYEFIRK
jgi:hypothetical protein